MTAYATAGGKPIERATVHVPYQGPWFADVSWLDAAPDVGDGAITLTIGSASFVGTIDPAQSGVFGEKRSARIVAGANGWQRSIEARGYANDAGVKASTVAADAANAAKERLGSFSGGADRLGAHYTRESGAASRTLEDAARGASWWVDYSGVTHVGTRPNVPAPGSYTLLSYDPRSNLAVLSVDSVDAVTIGSALVDADRLPSPVTVRQMEISVAPNALRVTVWCGVRGESFLTETLRSIVGRLTDQRLTGKYRYRVVQQNGAAVDLQWVKRTTVGVEPPDMLRVPMAPGVSGSHARLTNGCIVYVEFVGGMRDDPLITAFEGRGNAASVPSMLELGGEGGQPVARQGDTVTFPLPPFVFNGTVGGLPATGVMICATGQTTGLITVGSSKVKVAP
jgi:hypothetical protein